MDEEHDTTLSSTSAKPEDEATKGTPEQIAEAQEAAAAEKLKADEAAMIAEKEKLLAGDEGHEPIDLSTADHRDHGDETTFDPMNLFDPDPSGGHTDALLAGDTTKLEHALALAQKADNIPSDIHEHVSDIVKQFATTQVAPGNIHPDTPLFSSELAVPIDAVVNVGAAVADHFGIRIAPSEAENFSTIRDILRFVLRRFGLNP